MAHVRLHRSKDQDGRLENLGRGLCLNGVAELRACAVQLHEVHVCPLHASLRQNPAEERLLHGATGRREARTAPVVVRGGGLDAQQA